jgi:O-antigen/teichoic acid export membrane protein
VDDDMTRTARILKNIASNWIGFVIAAGVTILLTPFVLRRLGPGGYGIWALTSSVVGYYGLLDLGFRSGVNQYLTRALAVRDYRRASEVMSTAVVALSALGAVMAVLSLLSASVVPRLTHLPAGLEHETFWCILIVGLAAAGQCAFFPYTAVFAATQRFDLANLIGVGTRVLIAGATWVLLMNDFGLIGISLATCGGSLVDYVVRWRVARRLVPELEIARRLASMARLKEIGSFGGWSFVASLSAYLYLHAQPLLIGWMMPIAAVGHYALALGLARQAGDVLNPIGMVLYPSAAELHARGERSVLERLYQDGSRLMLLATVFVVLLAGFWAEDFYRLWIGEAYLLGTPFASVATLLRIILIGTFVTYASNIAAQVMLGAGHVRLLALTHLSGAVLSLALTAVLIGRYGLLGVATASAVASVVAESLTIPLLLRRTLGLREWYRVERVFARPAVIAVLLAGFIAGVQYVMGPASDWARLVLDGAISAAGAAVLVLALGVTAAERRDIIVRPVRRLLGKRAGATAASTSA